MNYGLSAQERELLEEHIEKLSEENNDLLALNEKLQVRANESAQALQERSEELEERLNQWNDMENALRATKEREDQYKYQKEMLESKIKHKMELIGSLEKEKEEADREIARLENEIKIINGRAVHFQRA